MFSVRLYAAQEQPADPEKTRRESAYLEVFAQERERATGPRLRRIDDQIKRMEDLKDEIDTAETL